MVLDTWFTYHYKPILLLIQNCVNYLLIYQLKKIRTHLYGFFDQNERHLFRNLISVSGVGPSTAQIILSTYNTDEIISYITSADVAAIQHVKGIGAKTAQRIIIDLKDKVSKGMPTSDILFQKDNTIKQESLSALLALGFAKKGAEQKIDKVLKENPEITSVEDLVKMALSQM